MLTSFCTLRTQALANIRCSSGLSRCGYLAYFHPSQMPRCPKLAWSDGRLISVGMNYALLMASQLWSNKLLKDWKALNYKKILHLTNQKSVSRPKEKKNRVVYGSAQNLISRPITPNENQVTATVKEDSQRCCSSTLL